ncbi:hypothetical protein AX774_g688 [Zancudomyces culisetae]|uniref:Uncharacterized protein n=1 Tax=Zancudomyces culisetae TaxID=1213189 RepID=A0A1R1PXW6_ZANCU|nr:hypothetical protein AX774_g688 [Zancudomyces culisetae]|eukprot:OMH85757.1 hypothetical protein AX774_g688 [Zancudomyces culisetae]
MDSILAEIQYRILGLLRPVDFLIHESLRKEHSLKEQSEFANSMQELIMILASHVTQLRIDMSYKAAWIKGEPKKIGSQQKDYLLDDDLMVQRVAAAEAVRKSFSRPDRATDLGSGSEQTEGSTKDSTREDNNQPQNPWTGLANRVSIRAASTIAALLDKREGRRGDNRRQTVSLSAGMRKANGRPMGPFSNSGGLPHPVYSTATDNGKAQVETAPGQPKEPGDHRAQSFDVTIIARNRRGRGPKKRVLLQPLRHFKEDRGRETRPQLKATERVCPGPLVQDGNPAVCHDLTLTQVETAPGQPKEPGDHRAQSFDVTIIARNRRGRGPKKRVLLQPLRHFKEDRGRETRPQLKATERVCPGPLVQDGNPAVCHDLTLSTISLLGYDLFN